MQCFCVKHSLWCSSSCAIKVEVDCGYTFAMFVGGDCTVLSFVGGLHTTNLQFRNVIQFLISLENLMETRTIDELFIAVEPD
jgi:hypothetical protein